MRAGGQDRTSTSKIECVVVAPLTRVRVDLGLYKMAEYEGRH